MDQTTQFVPAGWPAQKTKRPRSPSQDFEFDENRGARSLTPFSGVSQTLVKEELSDSPEKPSSQLSATIISGEQIKSSPAPSIKPSPSSPVRNHTFKEDTNPSNDNQQMATDEDLFVDQESAPYPKHPGIETASGSVGVSLGSKEDDSEADEFPLPVAAKGVKKVVDVSEESSSSFQTKARGSNNKTGNGAITSKRQDGVQGAEPSPNKTNGTRKKRSPRTAKCATKPTINSGVKGIRDNLEFLGYDPIAAHHAEPEIEEAPSIEALTKTKQLADMLAGCPSKSDMRRNKADVNAIEKASRVFGRNRVKAKDGFWLPDRMKTGIPLLTSPSTGPRN